MHTHDYEFNRHCGATVCYDCGHHKGFSNCYCGWSLANDGSGYENLIEMGETIEPDYGYGGYEDSFLDGDYESYHEMYGEDANY